MKILNITPWAIYPADSGGRLRCYNISKNLTEIGNSVTNFSQDIIKKSEVRPCSIKKIRINNNYLEYRYINFISLATNYLTVSTGASKVFSGAILRTFNPKLLSNLIENSELIQIDAPWQFDYVDSQKSNVPKVLNGHNVEYDRLASTKNVLSKHMLKIIKDKESDAVNNSDLSIKNLKGNKRPIIPLESRIEVLNAIKPVDFVISFEELTPIKLISLIKPDIHVKGGDYTVESLPESKLILEYGGNIKIINLVEGFSTTNVVNSILEMNK
jgi:rfaE bifunctional protein nucleotidyltransferase chain/domain